MKVLFETFFDVVGVSWNTRNSFIWHCAVLHLLRLASQQMRIHAWSIYLLQLSFWEAEENGAKRRVIYRK